MLNHRILLLRTVSNKIIFCT